MITTVTLNASIDKAYHMTSAIENGTVMRVSKTCNSAGGKGINVARIIKTCGSDVQATGLVGGYNGAYLEKLLDQDGISHNFEHIKGETRSCINILDPKYSSTEYLEVGCTVDCEEEKSFLERFDQIIQESDVITISGSAPQGISKDIYKKMVEMVKKAGKKVFLDTSGELLERGLEAKPDLVKPNKDEIEALFHIKIDNRDDVITYARKIYDMGIPNVVISLGGEGAILVCEKGIYQAKPPKVEVVNTVGCGDSMVGAFAVAMERGFNPEDALCYAVVVATANALSASTGSFDPAECAKIEKGTKVTELLGGK
ncbi:MAG: 1-phosphofructokinase [Anaerobutyricum sp.]|nr:1-phosphofructokinase [Anaerobutyricum sp.]